MIVDIDYYDNVYFGESVPAAVFPRYSKRAEEAVAALTRNRVNSGNITQYPEFIQTAYRGAICAQIEYYSYNGISAANNGTSDDDYTMGRISVSTPSVSAQAAKRKNSSVCSQAVTLLECAGLLNPQCDVFGGA